MRDLSTAEGFRAAGLEPEAFVQVRIASRDQEEFGARGEGTVSGYIEPTAHDGEPEQYEFMHFNIHGARPAVPNPVQAFNQEFYCMSGCINLMGWGRTIGGIALAVEGEINKERTGIIRSDLLPHWAGLDMAKILLQEFGAPALLCSLDEIGDKNALSLFLLPEGE